MRRVLCSTGALLGRPNGRDYRLLRSYAPELECDGFEFMLYETWYDELDAMVREVSSLGLSIPTLHCEKGIGEFLTAGELREGLRRFGINCRVAHQLGAKLLILHLWNGIPSDSRIENNYSALPYLTEEAERWGLVLTVENVVCNCRDPMTHFDELSERFAELRFTFDTKMAAFHGQVADIFAPERAGLWQRHRIAHLHINDYGGGYMDWQNLRVLHLGDGNVELDGFFRALAPLGYRGDFTVEATAFSPDGSLDTAPLNRDFAFIRRYIGED